MHEENSITKTNQNSNARKLIGDLMWSKIPDFQFGTFSHLSVCLYNRLKVKTHKTEISSAILNDCGSGCKTSDWASRKLHIDDLRNL
jgi:hypothetical protein